MDIGISHGQEARAWAKRQFGKVNLGDRRLTGRLVRTAAEMVQEPSASIPQQMGNVHQAKGSYRLFGNAKVSYAKLLKPHWSETRQEASRRATVLLIQDTTELDYTGHVGTSGLGPIGNGQGRGFLQHNTLAVDPSGEGEVLGLAYSQLELREPVPAGEGRRESQQRRRESAVWSESVEAVGSSGTAARWIHVGDRGADTFETYGMCERVGVGYVIRVSQNRRMWAGHGDAGTPGYLLDYARRLPSRGEQTVTVRPARNRKKRRARLAVAWAPVRVAVPWLRKKGDGAPLDCWVLRVWEVNPPKGQEPIEWVLLTDQPIATLETAQEVVGWYAKRWLVEEYHKCLKTGCRVEASQLREADRLEAVIAIKQVVAATLLELKLTARRAPETPATEVVSPEHVQVLSAYRGIPIAALTARRFWREVARLGGFLARKSDGDPGWQTTWRGWHKLDLMVLGARLAQGEAPRCG